MNFKHFLLTRFNVPFLRQENIDYLFGEEYLSERFRIFKEICFKSIEQQTDQDFIWLVFFDSRTPNQFKELNKIWSEQYKNYHPIYIDMDDKNISDVHFYQKECLKASNKEKLQELTYAEKTQKIFLASKISSIINNFCDVNDELVITTRIDNDDAFHKEMMKNVKANIPEKIQDSFIISFDKGMQYINNSKIARSYFYPNNHFTSLIEKRSSNLLTVLYWDHFFVDKYIRVKHILTQPLWLEICHKTNVVNSLSLTSDSNFVWGLVDLKCYGINCQWNSFDTLICLFLHPTLYVVPEIKMLIRKIIR